MISDILSDAVSEIDETLEFSFDNYDVETLAAIRSVRNHMSNVRIQLDYDGLKHLESD